MTAFSLVLRDALPHGILAGVSLPATPDAVPAEVLDRLHPDEARFASTLAGWTRVRWVGGRLAARAALRSLGAPDGPILTLARGEPRCPPGTSLSISHSGPIAVALAARRDGGTVGVDIQPLGAPRSEIANKVLTEAERAATDALPEPRRWPAILQRFAVKEAVYKALAPRLQRWIGFEEAEVLPDPEGDAAVRLHLSLPAPEVRIVAGTSWYDDTVLATVRAVWRK